MVRCRTILLMLALASPSLARADAIMTFSEATALLAKSCGAEIKANCRGVNLDAKPLKECLSRNQDVMSPDCKANFLVPFDQIQKRINAETVNNVRQTEGREAGRGGGDDSRGKREVP